MLETDLVSVVARRAAIDRKLDELQQAERQLLSDVEDLRTTERVLGRLQQTSRTIPSGASAIIETPATTDASIRSLTIKGLGRLSSLLRRDRGRW
ncbi:MAG: hypothetical protein R3C30_09315 [Hyphomonadaceae bacterium]